MYVRTMDISTTLPVKPNYGVGIESWLPLVRRLKAAGKSQGHSIVTVHVIVDEFGNAQWWGQPTVCHIEPKAKGEALEKLLRALAG